MALDVVREKAVERFRDGGAHGGAAGEGFNTSDPTTEAEEELFDSPAEVFPQS